jgi:hypothetical protein
MAKPSLSPVIPAQVAIKSFGQLLQPAAAAGIAGDML